VIRIRTTNDLVLIRLITSFLNVYVYNDAHKDAIHFKQCTMGSSMRIMTNKAL
jgi:hypothetical protein